MSYQPEFFERIRCGRSKKRECVELIDLVVTLSERARRMGLLAREDDLDNIKDPLLKKGLLLVVDGTDPVVVRDVLYAFMLSSYRGGIGLLKAVMILEGVLAIQSGDNPRLIAEKLSVFLGKDIDLWETFRDNRVNVQAAYGSEYGAAPAGGVFTRSEETVNSVVKGMEFENLADVADRFIQMVLREVDTRDLALALKGASSKLQNKIFSNMSNRAAMLLKEDMDYMGPVRMDDVIRCQERILTIACRLAEAGEIIFPGDSGLLE